MNNQYNVRRRSITYHALYATTDVAHKFNTKDRQTVSNGPGILVPQKRHLDEVVWMQVSMALEPDMPSEYAEPTLKEDCLMCSPTNAKNNTAEVI